MAGKDQDILPARLRQPSQHRHQVLARVDGQRPTIAAFRPGASPPAAPAARVRRPAVRSCRSGPGAGAGRRNQWRACVFTRQLAQSAGPHGGRMPRTCDTDAVIWRLSDVVLNDGRAGPWPGAHGIDRIPLVGEQATEVCPRGVAGRPIPACMRHLVIAVPRVEGTSGDAGKASGTAWSGNQTMINSGPGLPSNRPVRRSAAPSRWAR